MTLSISLVSNYFFPSTFPSGKKSFFTEKKAILNQKNIEENRRKSENVWVFRSDLFFFIVYDIHQ